MTHVKCIQREECVECISVSLAFQYPPSTLSLFFRTIPPLSPLMHYSCRLYRGSSAVMTMIFTEHGSH